MPDSDVVLELTGLRVEPELGEAPHAPINLVLRAGELAVIRLATPRLGPPLSDAFSGLISPVEGTVQYLGQDWNELSVARANALRASIGRVAPDFAWISNLDVEENVILCQMHETHRQAADIRAEARRWAQAFGMPDGLPRGRPANISRDLLRRSACARAFLGGPKLIILDRPTDGGFAGLAAPLVEAASFLRSRHAAILWAADAMAIPTHPALRPTWELTLA